MSVDVATNGVDGLERARTAAYDLVILDLMLPGRHGASVLEELMQECPDQRVLVLSAIGGVESKVNCLGLGASDYLTKPFALAELLARVRARLRETASAPAERQLRAAGIVLDLDTRAVTIGDRQVALSTREFMLLQHVMRRRGTVCTRQELLSVVWGYNHEPGRNVVDVCIMRLRTKLQRPVIETIRNVGYRRTSPGSAATWASPAQRSR